MVQGVAVAVQFDFPLTRHGIAPKPVSFCQVDQPPDIKTPVEVFLHLLMPLVDAIEIDYFAFTTAAWATASRSSADPGLLTEFKMRMSAGVTGLP
jgi:hypothetical protein